MYSTIQKTIIAWAFNHYIAYYYFDNVNVSQLKVAFEKGEIELENLPVKKDALKHLKLPWNVVTGVVGKLSIKIPLLTLLTDPWQIKLNDLILTVSPRKQDNNGEDNTEGQSKIDLLQDNSDASLAEYLENSTLEDDGEQSTGAINSEETKLAEFYSSFSATVSSVVKDIYKNIKLEIESITLIFENFRHGIVRFSADNLLLHRPNSARNLYMDNVAIHLSSIGSHDWPNHDDLLRVNLDSCDLEFCDVSNNGNHTSLEINGVSVVKGDLVIVGSIDTSSIPLCEFLLEDLRILYFSADHQQDGSIFAKISCCHFNREVSTWDTLLKPWPFNLSWDKRTKHRKISLTSDESAEFTMSSALLDLVDVVRKRISAESFNSKLWPVAVNQDQINYGKAHESNSILLLHNETGHRLHYASNDEYLDPLDLSDRSKSASPTMRLDGTGDTTAQSITHKLSISSKSSMDNDKDSTEYNRSTGWTSVEIGETVPLKATKILLVRVEGWKTLLPVRLDKTGLFFREAFSDRVKNEDTFIAISIELEERSARKIITVRSSLNLVNLLDATLEIHFADSNQALYIKPEGQLALPLPYLFGQMYIRPCNVGVTMSERPLVWDEIREVISYESHIHICQPITMTNKKHASYCGSQAYRICAFLHRENQQVAGEPIFTETTIPVFSLTFMPPLSIMNLLPYELRYHIDDISGSLAKGGQQRIYHVDTTKPTDLHFEMNGFPRSKAIKFDPGATGSFQYTLEMIDKNHRSLYLNAKIIFVSMGEEPAVQVIISAPYWFINKTKLPIIIKQEGAALECAGQYREHEENAISPMLFSFYDTELEPPWLCSMRLGKSKGASLWCDGFKLDKGSGQRRLCFIPANSEGESKMSRSMIDINIRRGFGKYSDTTIVTLTTRYGFDCLAKTPKKAYESSPQDYKLFYYNFNTNLAKQIGGRPTIRQLFTNQSREGISEITFVAPGLKITLIDCARDRIAEVSFENVVINSTTKAKEQIIGCSIQDIRIENALPDCEKSVILDRASSPDQGSNSNPALRLIMDRILGRSFGTVWFRQVQLSMCELVLNIEEKLFLKLVEFISFRDRTRHRNMANLHRDMDKILYPEEDNLSKYYFDLLRIDLSSLKLSVFTTTNLPTSLQKLKSCLKLKFFGFEDARVQLSPYFKMNVSRTLRGIFDSVTRFYKRQISEQAPRIVGQQIQSYLRFHLSDLLSSLYDEVYNKLFY